MLKSWFLGFGLLSSSLTLVFAQQSGPAVAPNSGSILLVDIDGTRLTLADYERKHPTGLFHARNVFYEAHRKAAEQFVDEYLLEREAKKEGLTVDQLVEKHINSAAGKEPSDEALRVYYEGVDTQEPFEKVKPQIIQAIKERRIAKARAEYLKELRSQAKISIRVGPPRADVDLANTPVRGPQDAPITLVEFADYECPYCQQIQPVLDRLEQEYKGKIRFAYKDIPLPMHANAEKSAEASHCAGVQGKYWQYHDMLFQTKQLELPQLKEHARTLKLDAAAFDKCLDNGDQAARIKPNITEGQNLGIQGTPSFFINGRSIGGGQSYEDFKRIVDEELAAASAAKSMNTTAKR
jgi:protein-disulfide isomerase